MEEFPELTIVAKGNSGIEIKTKLPEKFNCVEFTLRDDIPVSIFISPWMQFEPAKMNEFRQKIAHEIVRRTLAYDELVKQVENLQKLLEQSRDAHDRDVLKYHQMLAKKDTYD